MVEGRKGVVALPIAWQPLCDQPVLWVSTQEPEDASSERFIVALFVTGQVCKATHLHSRRMRRDGRSAAESSAVIRVNLAHDHVVSLGVRCCTRGGLSLGHPRGGQPLS
jgi:hypothetical protein